MKKFLRLAFFSSVSFIVASLPALAQEVHAAVSVKEGANGWAIFVGAGFAIAIPAFGAAAGMGKAITAALEGVARNPSVAPRIMTMMILGLALIESLVIYALVVAILMLFTA
ncbi:hypothetical protein RsTz2092_04590 [Deferribacterales bacterium RsTz2092]|nr:hypothetical protein AGMMS49941_11430 [Deferribacterales bacterium]